MEQVRARRRACGRANAARGVAVVVLALLVPGLGAVGARGDAAQDAADAAATAERAQSQAAQAALRVDQLTQAYTEASAQVRQGLAALAASFSASAQAEASADAARSGLAQARIERAREVRALYASGGSPTLAASVLTAQNPQDALWRVSMAQRVMADLVVRSRKDVESRQDGVTSSVVQQRDADAQAQAVALGLEKLQADAAAAQGLLEQAHGTLGALDASARNATTAAFAATKLAEAEARARAAQRAATALVVSAAGIPAEYLAAYQKFGTTCSGLRWTLLAAVGQVESGHGRDNGPSSAGAIGPMQFMPATFAVEGVDGDGDGTKDAWDPEDAIASAAHYLCVSGVDGTPAGDQRAIFAYNHAQSYVNLVLDTEASIKAQATTP